MVTRGSVAHEKLTWGNLAQINNHKGMAWGKFIHTWPRVFKIIDPTTTVGKYLGIYFSINETKS